jgi:hypothetical protein
MNEALEVSSDWLALREAEDSRARSHELARSVLPLLAKGPITVHDLGSGTGSMMRWLAPLLPSPQTWVLHDWNASLTERALAGAPPRDLFEAPVSIRSHVGELERLDGSDLRGASLVTASALLDVLTAREAQAIVDACVEVGAATLFCLSVTGEVELRPWDARDKLFEEAFNCHQRREVHGRRLLGRYGGPLVRGLFDHAGWKVRTVRTCWRLDDHEPRLLGEWFTGWVDAAEEHRAALCDECVGYRELRGGQLDRGDLSAVVYHLDLLAWPR